MNRVETDSFATRLSAAGWSPSSLEAADLIIVNTCTVTAEADKKTRKSVRHGIRGNGRAPVIVTGCSSALDPAFYEDLSDRVTVVPKGAMDGYLDLWLARRADDGDGSDPAGAPLDAIRTRHGVKVQDGCDNACAYCIVCKARGPSRSMDPARVCEDVRTLIAEGSHEVVLTGINLGAYRWEGTGLEELLRMLIEDALPPQTGSVPNTRLRLSSIEPTDITDGLIELMASADGVLCRHLHIPLQSGSSRILAAMERSYDADDYLALIQRIRDSIPSASLSTDIIVGFPGETEEDFERTCDLAQRCGFSRIHVFPYSKREGTVAAGMADQVGVPIKQRRAAQLRRIAEELRHADAAARFGREEVFCIEEGGLMMSESYHEVPADPTLPTGQLVVSAFPALRAC